MKDMSMEIIKMGNAHQEIPRDNWETLIFLQRHGRYDNRKPEGELAKEEQDKLGHLTAEGINEVREITQERLDIILKNKKDDTDFLLISSPTFWYDDTNLGQRAMETANVIAEEIKNFFQKNNFSQSRLLNEKVREGRPAFKGVNTRPEERIGEAKMFQVPEFVDFLRKEYKGQGPDFWNNFNLDTHKDLREKTGAEGPADIANRVNIVMNVAARFASKYHQKNPGRKLVVWMVSHGDDLEPYVQRILNVPNNEFDAKYNEGIGVAINSDGGAMAHAGGKKYKAEFYKKGLPKKI